MNDSHSRPFGVTLTALFFLVIAIISLLLAARYVLNPAGNREMILLFTRLKLPVTFLNLLAVPPLISAGLATLMFRGLWEERAWSRVAAVVLGFMGMLTALAAIAFIQVFNYGGSRAMWSAAAAFALSALIFIYFLKLPWPEQTPASFSRQDAAPPEAAAGGIAQPPPPEPSPAIAIWPEGYDSIHNAPTVKTDAATAQDADTIRLTPEQPLLPRAFLTVTSGAEQGRRFEIVKTDIVIGRHPTLADIVLTDPTVSAQHARLRFEEGQFILYDLDSTNGSFVNAQRIHMQPVEDQDQIMLGALKLIFTIDGR